ncbi:choice-of-anchor Q domain-containing protein [Coraliomargarita algicola]|uniref:Choice-of-anchor Q domain-containing protein n=1 Tax=Coraliomargarita algicola TaxID=3092156 RepID=A0ABZ0RRH9_9BACT|nr:choice-of-anchor Q domain-containing protein [Coraliomargarita sp. J2-16]WPJ97507.1 choice-of-anchor Q domain-containing protein [Coraliomargarita sp. J2-16]
MGDQFNAFADLGLLADNGGPTFTHALGSSSDAIDAGMTDLTTDQRGFFRLAGLADDIGAYELGAIPEPETFALIAALGALGLVMTKRRR